MGRDPHDRDAPVRLDHEPRASLDRESDNLFDFFLDHVEQAVVGNAAPVSEESVWYLTSLLVDRSRPDESEQPDTLVELHLQARTGDRSTAIRAYRHLGDRALYVSGFFRQSLARKLVSRKYYLDMGAAAYDSLAGLLRAAGFGGAALVGDGGGGSKGLDGIYDELAHAFESCSEVLGEVCETVREQARGELSDADILALYEEWQATGSPRIANKLARLGLVPAGALPAGSA
ncbi:MAG: hypothetical protein H6742_19885 [Alphaproteobacteria bacterium]|nr:hypothetical protein [Alphaproteobacteria bacterium]